MAGDKLARQSDTCRCRIGKEERRLPVQTGSGGKRGDIWKETIGMTVKELAECDKFRVINLGESPEREITKLFCCDLLSIAMGRAPEGSAWVTVMGNINTLAVASLADVACVIMAEGAVLDDMAANKAVQQGITVLATEDPIFETALAIHEMIHG